MTMEQLRTRLQEKYWKTFHRLPVHIDADMRRHFAMNEALRLDARLRHRYKLTDKLRSKV